ncbi:MAG: hypothetical protein Q4A23_02480 [bacterium]|nr:hypothetical protein [bacterium]
MTKKQAEAKKVIEKKVTKKDTSLMKAKTLLTNNGIAIAENGEVIVDQTVQDFRSAVLVLSLAINLVVFLTWVVLQYTNAYDTALIQAFLIR